MRLFKKLIILSIILLIILLSFFAFYISRYKFEFKDIILLECEKYNISPSVVFSIIKNESSFNEFAQSSAGACGLMQLMPSTAEWCAKQLKIDSIDLFNPKDNIMLGVWYINYLYNYYDDLDWAIVSYNAGIKETLNWRKSKIAFNKLPFEETRKYYSKVKQDMKVYSILLNTRHQK